MDGNDGIVGVSQALVNAYIRYSRRERGKLVNWNGLFTHDMPEPGTKVDRAPGVTGLVTGLRGYGARGARGVTGYSSRVFPWTHLL